VHIENGVTYISEQGQSIIKMDFLKDSDTSTETHTERIQDTRTDTLILMLQKELEVKNKQIEELTATIRIQAESINAANKNELAETIIDGGKLIEGKSKKGWQFWKRR